MTPGLLLSSIGVLIAGSGVCAFWGRPGQAVSRLGAAVSAAGALLAILPAASVLWTGRQISMRLPWQVPFGSFHVAVDPLSALFILVISVVCALAAVYGVSYLKIYSGRKHLGACWCFFNLLFASMLMVVIARNAVLFLFAWEAMSLSSFFLVVFEHEKPEVREAGWIYLAAAHLGTAFLLVLFVLLGGRNASLDFDGFAAPSGLAPAGALFLLALAGFGAKAGFLPMHVWLPEAHPAAPSHVSAVMSGVMIKTGIYGLVRIVSFLGVPAPWWGWTLLTVGAASGIMGVLFALAQHDFKRLLAYHSVENIGIICLGLGLWLLGMSAQEPVLAALGLMGGLLHVCNHALFKALLFLGAGAVVHASGTRNMDALGGLQKRMPHTALTFAVGSAAICGLPPLNGFVSEFLIYLGAYGTLNHSPFSGNLAAGGLITLVSLGLIGGLAVACFTKVFGIVFLGEPRSRHGLEAHEVEKPMRHAMTALAGLCVLLGLAAPLALGLVAPAAAQLLETPPAPALASAKGILWRISLCGGLLALSMTALLGFRRLLLSGRTVACGPTWDCGFAFPNARMQYTASSFAWPVIHMFRWVLRPRLHVQMEGLFPGQAHLESHSEDLFYRALFAPLFRSFDALSRRLRWLQQGRNQFYVLYIAVTILVLLLMKVR
jgi:formate hydrogenlyase subunit 3/multisubunit Na+/H+ antiporter MnhD subunit